ncbi:hypothetical protein NX786_13335 [Telluria mixta]|uniref:CdiI immunity protein domain-containing protein n=1 Tax=Telluria mixta TaxID=34071 RepID=A0ABT2BYW2_9BURK|nr:hypothetical protein [Telluria mixta]MCS0630320.1 hypothetical protein [Telluria mixta]WEM94370.1 hypothetical protein P0M04_23150 [Telluria mixta]
MRKDSEDFMSWLKYLDIEYLNETTCNAVSDLDINDPTDWSSIIELTMREDVTSFSSAARASMIKVLDDLADYPELEVRKLIDERVAMPFDTPLRDYLPFFEHVRRVLFDYAATKRT